MTMDLRRKGIGDGMYYILVNIYFFLFWCLFFFVFCNLIFLRGRFLLLFLLHVQIGILQYPVKRVAGNPALCEVASDYFVFPSGFARNQSMLMEKTIVPTPQQKQTRIKELKVNNATCLSTSCYTESPSEILCKFPFSVGENHNFDIIKYGRKSTGNKMFSF